MVAVAEHVSSRVAEASQGPGLWGLLGAGSGPADIQGGSA